jgi:Ca2+:H+ antiporter
LRQDRAVWLLLLVPAPIVVVVDRIGAASELVLFVLACGALAPLAWLIGEATGNVAQHTGPGVGAFLNASFGNAPELIIALVAVSEGLPEVVRASLTGSIVGNLLLVLGFSLLVARPSGIDRSSAFVSGGTVAVAVLFLLVPSIAGFDGDPERHTLAELSLPFAVGLLAVRVFVNLRLLRRFRRRQAETDRPVAEVGLPLSVAVGLLAVATVLTALVTETLVGSIGVFADRAHLSAFFVAAVIVALVGNATEHGSAVLLAARGEVELATEISLASSAQVAGFLIPVVALLSWAIDPLALSFRPIELVAVGGAALAAGAVLMPGKTSRPGGAALVGAYLAAAVSFYVAGER